MVLWEGAISGNRVNQLRGYVALLSGLIKRDLRTKYAGSYLGLLWSVMYPGVLFGIYYFVCKMVFRLELKNPSYGYAEYLFCGLWPWVVFSDVVSRCSRLFVDNASMIKKTIFPLNFLVFSAVGTGIVELCLGLVIFFLYLMFQGGADYVGAVLARVPILFLALLFLTLITSGIGTFLASISVFFKDLQQLVSVILNVWFYGTPIIYSADMVPKHFRVIFNCNPFFYVIDMFRWFFLGRREAGLIMLGSSFVIVILACFLSHKIYKDLRKDFATFV